MDERYSTSSLIWRLAWPIMLEQILIMMVNYADTAMVGAIGPNASAAVALTSSTNWLINGIMAGMAMGFGVPVGNYLGANRAEDARRVVRQAVLAIFMVGAAMTAIMLSIAPHLPHWLGGDPEICGDATAYISIIGSAYIFAASVQVCSCMLRCTGNTKTPLLYNGITNIMNVILNFLLIYPVRNITLFGITFKMWGAGMGVMGAAVATAVSTTFTGVMLLLSLFGDRFRCSISIKDKFRFNGAIWKDMLRIGTPVAFERVCISSGQILMTAMVTALGTDFLAAHSLAMTVESITYMPSFGFGAAATTLVSQSLGAGRLDKAKKFSNACVIGCTVFMSAMGFVLFFGGEWMMSLLTPSAHVIAIGAAALKVEALAQPGFALSSCMDKSFCGARKTRWPFIIGLIGMWCVRLPICFVLTKYTDLALTGAWIGMAADLTVRGIIATYLYLKRDWMQLPVLADTGDKQ